jgi:hypothetical protein
MVDRVAQLPAAVVHQQIAIAVIAKRLDAAKSQGRAAIQLIQSAQQLGKALGRGQRFDALA